MSHNEQEQPILKDMTFDDMIDYFDHVAIASVDTNERMLSMGIQVSKKLRSMQKALAGLVESYDILMQETPLGKNLIAAGVIRGAFIWSIENARKELKA